MNPTEIISLVAISLLSTIAAVIGIQIIFILKEVKHSVTKLNSALDTTEAAMQRFAAPVGNLVTVVEGLKQSTKIIEIVSSFLSKHNPPKPPIEINDTL